MYEIARDIGQDTSVVGIGVEASGSRGYGGLMKTLKKRTEMIWISDFGFKKNGF